MKKAKAHKKAKRNVGKTKAKAKIKEKNMEEKKEGAKDSKYSYEVITDHVTARVNIVKNPGESIHTYVLDIPQLEPATLAFLDDVKIEFLKKATISREEALDIRMAAKLQERFSKQGRELIRKRMPHLSDEMIGIVCAKLMQEMLGLGDIEFFLSDDWIEEICVNSANSPIWIYHKNFGWIKTNVIIPTENQIWNLSSSIARGVGRQITTQRPLLDAYLRTGDRVNATLMPVSAFGNTITIRKFARKAWTITDFIRSKTISTEVAALLWLSIQYETNILISGGTGSGKTSLLNVLSAFIPQNHRVVSIEQTREIVAPSHLQWVPLVVRESTSEGAGGVDMLDLLVNSLRMRPDRIIVGEIRRAEEAEVLFEAMHTGHSVYATLHAETVSETLRRLTHPPIDIPAVMLESLHLLVTMYRDRRTGIRRIFEIGEMLPMVKDEVKTNIIYKWDPKKDKVLPHKKSERLLKSLKVYTNMSDADIRKDLAEKREVLDWLVKKNVETVEGVGEIISKYYDDPKTIMTMVRKK